MPSHEMIQINRVWECLSCTRRMIFTADAEELVLDQGNPRVAHFGRVGDAPVLGLRREL